MTTIKRKSKRETTREAMHKALDRVLNEIGEHPQGVAGSVTIKLDHADGNIRRSRVSNDLPFGE